MTIDDVRDRYLANRQIADPAARQADLDAIVVGITAEWGADHVDMVLERGVAKISEDYLE